MTMPKPFLWFLFAVALIGLVGGGVVWWVNPQSSRVPLVEAPVPVTNVGPNERLDVLRDTTLVFQKARWRHPAVDDVILGAERRELADAGNGGVKTWQWFLAVRPGHDLRAWLDTNPFALNSGPRRSSGEGSIPPPEWFPRDLNGFAKRQNMEGRLVFWYSAEQNLLYASDSGFGFNDAQRAL
jgi:hypothetical protein